MTAPEGLPRALARALTRDRGGCLTTAVGGLVLSVLAPVVAAVRAWQAWRRGGQVRFTRSWRVATTDDGGRLARIQLDVDLPIRTAGGFPTRLTDTVARVAEALRRPDDSYHLVARGPGEPAALIQPLGPQVQELGERLALDLGRSEMTGRSTVWLALARSQRLSDLVDPSSYDPDDSGEPDRLVLRSGARWAAATWRGRVGPGLLVRTVLWVPEATRTEIEAILDRLQS